MRPLQWHSWIIQHVKCRALRFIIQYNPKLQIACKSIAMAQLVHLPLSSRAETLILTRVSTHGRSKKTRWVGNSYWLGGIIFRSSCSTAMHACSPARALHPLLSSWGPQLEATNLTSDASCCRTRTSTAAIVKGAKSSGSNRLSAFTVAYLMATSPEDRHSKMLAAFSASVGLSATSVIVSSTNKRTDKIPTDLPSRVLTLTTTSFSPCKILSRLIRTNTL